MRLVAGTRVVLDDGRQLLLYPTDRAAWSRMTRLLTVGKLPELRDFSFQGARAWDRIRPLLDAAPRTLRRHPLVDRLIASTAEPPGGVRIDR